MLCHHDLVLQAHFFYDEDSLPQDVYPEPDYLNQPVVERHMLDLSFLTEQLHAPDLRAINQDRS